VKYGDALARCEATELWEAERVLELDTLVRLSTKYELFPEIEMRTQETKIRDALKGATTESDCRRVVGLMNALKSRLPSAVLTELRTPSSAPKATIAGNLCSPSPQWKAKIRSDLMQLLSFVANHPEHETTWQNYEGRMARYANASTNDDCAAVETARRNALRAMGIAEE
jgi:hypothetical protein